MGKSLIIRGKAYFYPVILFSRFPEKIADLIRSPANFQSKIENMGVIISNNHKVDLFIEKKGV